VPRSIKLFIIRKTHSWKLLLVRPRRYWLNGRGAGDEELGEEGAIGEEGLWYASSSYER
jgi:hypothetical protein